MKAAYHIVYTATFVTYQTMAAKYKAAIDMEADATNSAIKAARYLLSLKHFPKSCNECNVPMQNKHGYKFHTNDINH